MIDKKISFFLYFTILYSSFFSLFPKLIVDKYMCYVVKMKELKNSNISFVKDSQGTIFLVKQKKNVGNQLAIVREALSAYIATLLNIPAHCVSIIPADSFFPGKMYKKLPATIHTVVPGKTVREIYNQFDSFCIQQKWKSRWSHKQKGLTVEVIKNMALHPDLPKIVALDTFIGNSDRHTGNIFYNSETDQFYAIDMDDTFNKDLAKMACDHIKEVMNDTTIHFTQSEINGLIKYQNYLKKLAKKCSIPLLHDKLFFFANKAGFKKGQKLYSKPVQQKLSLYKKMIEQSYKSTQALIDLLDKVIAYYSV